MKSKELTILEGIRGETKSKSDRMSVTASCALVIKRVTEEDAGHYTCLQYTRNARYPLSTFSLGFVRSDNVTTAATVMTVTNNNPTNHQDFMIRCAVVSVGLAALIIFVVTVNMWAKTTVKKTQMEENTEFIQ
ncbi:uncharacterized protein KZ484_013283 isoform 2-T2 [Pholidichthys leucotaenia]